MNPGSDFRHSPRFFLINFSSLYTRFHTGNKAWLTGGTLETWQETETNEHEVRTLKKGRSVRLSVYLSVKHNDFTLAAHETHTHTPPLFLAPHELHLHSKPSSVTCGLSIIALLKAACMSIGLTLFHSKYASCILAERLTTSSTVISFNASLPLILGACIRAWPRSDLAQSKCKITLCDEGGSH